MELCLCVVGGVGLPVPSCMAPVSIMLTSRLPSPSPLLVCSCVCSGVVLADGRQVSADLVVDCSGRQSKMSKWLAAAGVPQPRLSQVDASLGYASW